MALVKGKYFKLMIGSAISAPASSSSDFRTQLAAVGSNEIDCIAMSKNIEFKEPETTTTEVKLLGSTSGRQNQELDVQSPSKGELMVDMIMSPESDNSFNLLPFKHTVESTSATGYLRYSYASLPPTAGVAVVVTVTTTAGVTETNWLLNNATIETLGGVKVDPDGHATQQLKISAAADDCFVESDRWA